MTSSQMFIPKTITVGYNARSDTYTGKLAYIIYTDDKGKLRKERSWTQWRDHKLGRDDFDNAPTSGFVLNKGVGGARMSYGYNARNEYIRVYDPRNFEFEISVGNLLFILQECSSIKGKGLEGEFVYAWGGTTLVLLPVGCKEYDECIAYTKRQKIKFDKKDLQEGYSYIMKDGSEVLYLGRHKYNHEKYSFAPAGKRHIFLRLKPTKYQSVYMPETGLTKIAEKTSSVPLPQFPDEYDKFKESPHCGDVAGIKLEKVKFSNKLLRKATLIKKDDKYYQAYVSWHYVGFHGDREYLLYQDINPCIPELKNNKIELKCPDGTGGDRVKEQLLMDTDFYVIKVVTPQGKELEVPYE